MLTSCNSDDSNENTTEESTGDYWPTAVGNQWVLDQDGSESVMKIVSSEKINGDTYFKFDQFAGASEEVSGTAVVSIKKVKGDYYLKLDDIVYNSEGVTGKITGYEYIILKDYLEANQTWTGSFSQETSFNIPNFPSIKMTSKYTGTILEKGVIATIKGVSYKDVIKFKIHQESKVEGEGAVSVDTEYWVAKDVGIIRAKTGDSVSELISYIKK